MFPLANGGNHIPTPLTRLIGRDSELALSRALLEDKGARLLTLTGPGGIGKTRLALELALGFAGTFASGVHFVPLAAIADAHGVSRAALDVLGAAHSGSGSALDRLIQIVGERCTLLVLDNFEHVLAAARDIGRLLEECPGLSLLVTSREPLRLRLEHRLAVPPLPTAAPDGGLSASEELFIERAAAVRADLHLDAATAAAIRELCHRLDGVPLAVELAAVEVGVLTPAMMLANFSRGLEVFRAGPDAAARHQTLAGAVGWSYELLTAEQRALLRRLAVFQGGFTLAAAEAVCSGEDLPAERVLPLLAALHDKSLLQADDAGSAYRYRLLAIIREFALGRLHAAGELHALREQHLEWLVGLAQAAEAGFEGPDQEAWLDGMERDLPNAWAALDWAEATGRPEAALRILAGLWQLWDERGYAAEARQRLERLLPRAEAAPDVAAKAHWVLAFLAGPQGDAELAERQLARAAGLALRNGDRRMLARSAALLGFMDLGKGDPDGALAFFGEAFASGREASDRWSMHRSLLGQASLSLAVAGGMDDLDAELRRQLAAADLNGSPGAIANLQFGLALVAYRQHRFHECAVLARRALRARLALRDNRWAAYCLDVLAWVAARQRQPRQAAELLGAALALRQLVGADPEPRAGGAAAVAEHRRTVSTIRAAAGELALDEAMARARSLSAEDVERLAQPAPAPARACAGLGGLRELTSREREVAWLVARGCSNRQIADELVIALGTTERHIANILQKLGLTSRTQMAVLVTQELAPEPLALAGG